MLGHTIHDPEGLEGTAANMKGLGLLDVETTLLPEKTLTRITATHVASGQKIDGYEIHLGASHGPDCSLPFARIGNDDDGATSTDGLVSGTYIHGCFASDGFRSAYLKSLGANSSDLAFESLVEKTLDELAAHLEQHLDLDLMLELAGEI
jgi:adenosylcobyric acid synthase